LHERLIISNNLMTTQQNYQLPIPRSWPSWALLLWTKVTEWIFHFVLVKTKKKSINSNVCENRI
jgi:hypothetical protein